MGQVVGYIIVEVTGKMLEINGNRCGVAGAQTYLKSTLHKKVQRTFTSPLSASRRR